MCSPVLLTVLLCPLFDPALWSYRSYLPSGLAHCLTMPSFRPCRLSGPTYSSARPTVQPCPLSCPANFPTCPLSGHASCPACTLSCPANCPTCPLSSPARIVQPVHCQAPLTDQHCPGAEWRTGFDQPPRCCGDEQRGHSGDVHRLMAAVLPLPRRMSN